MKKERCHFGRKNILIESKWNLKPVEPTGFLNGSSILIESKWNLKVSAMMITSIVQCILIESKWNLKQITKAIEILTKKY